MKVLLIDDDSAVQLLIAVLLNRADIAVDVVGDGVDARERITDPAYDKVILDLMLPRATGLELLAHVRSMSPELVSRIIVVTAASERTLRELDGTGIRLIRKPFDIHEFVSEVLSGGPRDSVAQM